MDHLLPFGELKTRRVPRFSTKQYDRENFVTYPERQGWSQSDISAPVQSDRSPEELNAFLQDWLFFGVLYEFFGEALRDSDFVDGNGRYINTVMLRRYVSALNERKMAFEHAVSQAYDNRIITCLAKVSYEMREITFQAPQAVDSRLLLSIVILCDFLRRISGLSGQTFAAGHIVMREVSSSMFRVGWCPSTIKKLAATLDPASFFRVGRFAPPAVRDDRTHSKCIGRQCLASETHESTYTTDHVCPTSDCEKLNANHNELFTMLQKGQIPLVLYDGADSGNRRLKLIGYRPGLKYVAISHVWGDRLGNPRDNSLPRCQLEHLQFLVDCLYESGERPVPFWIDTMSCPTKPDEATDLAITYMRETYSDADKILLLDSSLRIVKHKGASDAEIALRVLCSGWTRRLWTLQEGALAKRLYVQFSDGAADLDMVHEGLKTDDWWLEYTRVCSNLDEIRGAWQRKANIVESGLFIDYASSVLRYRATSVETDEALCLTTLSGLDMRKILAVRPVNRMKEFWSLLPPPTKIVFRTGKTLGDEGFGWAPSSLLSSQKMRTIQEVDTSFPELFGHVDPFETFLEDFEPTSFDYHQTSTPIGSRGPSGLTIQWNGIRLGTWDGRLGLGFFLRDDKKRWFFVGCHVGQSVTTVDPPSTGTKELALILEKSPEELFSDLKDSTDSTTALIVSISQCLGDTIYAHIESVGFLHPQPTEATDSEDGMGIGALAGIVEHCDIIFQEKAQQQNRGDGASSSTGVTGDYLEMSVDSSSLDSLVPGAEDEEEGNLKVRMKDEKLTMLRNDFRLLSSVESEGITFNLKLNKGIFLFADKIMEHLTLPTQPELISIKVPCLISDECDTGQFESYLKRVNLTEEYILSCQNNGQDPESVLTHLQTWLFFGTLVELATIVDATIAFEPPLPHTFVHTNQDRSKVITTRHLRSLWSKIEFELNTRSHDEQDRYRQKIIRTIRRSNLLISKIGHSKFTPQHQPVILSIMLLNEFIMEAADLRELEDQRPYFRSHLLESVMRDKGWCPSDIDRLRLDLDITALLFTVQCGSPPCRKSHEQCSLMTCNARQILDSEEYLPKHVAGTSCDCDHMFADRDVLLESLDQGIIPVSVFNVRSDPPELETLRSNQVPGYVAISHVWSDLMGNRSANALPQCTLRSIQDRVNKLYNPSDSPTPFWIDTLSCPVEPESATEQAIALMRETYANADIVLVIDSYLERVNSQDMSDFETTLRIICTGWTRRLWTLQEGVLAKRISFQFADRSVDGDDVFMSLARPPISYTKIPIFHSWFEIRLNWIEKFDSLITDSDFIWMLYRALRFRTTSVPTDEPLCLSALAGVELKEILREQKDNRMRRFWELMPKVDTSLLYWNGPRLNVQGFRWAPASLLGTPPEAILASSAKQIRGAREAIRTPAGLVLTSPGVLLGKWTTSIRKSFWLKYDKERWFHVDLISDVGQPRTQSTEIAAIGQLQGLEGYPSGSQVLALLTHDSLLTCFNDPNFQIGEQPPSCALISIYGSKAGLFFASFESVGVIRPFKVEQALPISKFSIPTLANTVERAILTSMANTLQDVAGLSEDRTNMDHPLRVFLGETKSDPGDQVKFIDDPDVDATFEDNRLSLVVSGCHKMFHGAEILSTQRFCLG